jgi:hypothetical protein
VTRSQARIATYEILDDLRRLVRERDRLADGGASVEQLDAHRDRLARRRRDLAGAAVAAYSDRPAA